MLEFEGNLHTSFRKTATIFDTLILEKEGTTEDYVIFVCFHWTIKQCCKIMFNWSNFGTWTSKPTGFSQYDIVSARENKAILTLQCPAVPLPIFPNLWISTAQYPDLTLLRKCGKRYYLLRCYCAVSYSVFYHSFHVVT